MQVKWRGLKELKQGLGALRHRLFPGAVEVIHKTAGEIRKEMAVPGKPPTYPIPWDSPKQRRAFFATNGFGRGIPTKRTDEYVNAWKVIKHETGADVGNPLAHAGYIGGRASGKPIGANGKLQSNIHRGRWPLFRKVVDVAIEKLPKRIKNRISLVAREEGFKTK